MFNVGDDRILFLCLMPVGDDRILFLCLMPVGDDRILFLFWSRHVHDVEYMKKKCIKTFRNIAKTGKTSTF